jgi:hypothetical protein
MKTPYKIESIKSHAETSSIVQDGIINKFKTIFEGEKFNIIAWYDHEIIHGDSLDKVMINEYLKEIRVFNTHKELYLWKNGTDWLCRLRHDSPDEIDVVDTNVVNTEFVLRGVVAKQISTASGDTLLLHTRNYIEFKNNQAGYSDYRFVKIVKS